MNQKKLAIYIVTPVLAIAAVTAVALPNVVSPISQTGASALERTLVLDSSTNKMFEGLTGYQSEASNTASGNPITFTANYVTPSGTVYEGSYGSWNVGSGFYRAHAKYNGYRFYFTHNQEFNDLKTISIRYQTDSGETPPFIRLHISNSAFTTYPSDEGTIFSAYTVEGAATFNLSSSAEHYFAISFGGLSNHSSADYSLDLYSITINYLC